MGKRLVSGLLGITLLALAGCGGSGSVADPATSRLQASEPATTTKGDPRTVDVGSMGGMIVADDTVVLADSAVPTGFWSGPAKGDAHPRRLAGPDDPLWVKAMSVHDGKVLVVGAQCASMTSTDPEVVCSPGTAQLWRLDPKHGTWSHVADLGGDDLVGARFVAEAGDEVSLAVTTLATPKQTRVRLYDVDTTAGEATPVDVPAEVAEPPADSRSVICGDADGNRIAVVSGSESSGVEAWAATAASDGWRSVPGPGGVPAGRTPVAGCVGSQVMVSFPGDGAAWQSVLSAPGDGDWQPTAAPSWIVPRTGADPVLAVGNGHGAAMWQGTSLFTFDAATARWTETRYDAPADVRAVALAGDTRLAVATSGADHEPEWSIIAPTTVG